jgi:hypothetical protein
MLLSFLDDGLHGWERAFGEHAITFPLLAFTFQEDDFYTCTTPEKSCPGMGRKRVLPSLGLIGLGPG